MSLPTKSPFPERNSIRKKHTVGRTTNHQSFGFDGERSETKPITLTFILLWVGYKKLALVKIHVKRGGGVSHFFINSLISDT